MAGVAGRRPARTLIIVLMVVALVALLVGLFYFTIPADQIPSWLPGRVVTATAHHVRRATALVVVGVLCAVAAWMVARRAQAARRSARPTEGSGGVASGSSQPGRG